MASLALTSLLENALNCLNSSYPDETPPKLADNLELVQDRVKLCLQILKYLPERFYTDQHSKLKLLEEKLKIAASEAEYCLEERIQYQALPTFKMLGRAEDIDLLNKYLLKTLMPEIFNQEPLPYVVTLYAAEKRIFSFYCIRSNSSKAEKNEIFDFLTAKATLPSDSGSDMESRIAVRCDISRMENWFQIHDCVDDLMNMENWFQIHDWVSSKNMKDEVKDPLYSGTYTLRLNGSFQEVCESLCHHLLDNSYFIVMHNHMIHLRRPGSEYIREDNESKEDNWLSKTTFGNRVHRLVLGERTQTSSPEKLQIECLCHHLLDQSYFIVMHNHRIERRRSDCSREDNENDSRGSDTTLEDTFHHLVFGERSCPQELEIMFKDICTSCRDSSFALFVVATYLSKINPATHNWLIVQESILQYADMFHYKNYGIFLALIKASEDANSIQAEETGISFEKHEIKNKQAEIIEHLKASSEVAEAKDNEKVGIDECLEQLIPELLQSSRQLEKVAIVGMAGIGKTTLAKQIFDHASVSSHYDIRAWIDISQFYQKRNMLIQLLQGITHLTDDQILNEKDEDILEKVYKCLKGQRYFIIMDDMWSIKAWRELERIFPDDNLGSRILLTSRESNLIENLNCKIVHQMSLLSENKSWELLQKKVFGHEICPRGLAVIGKQIAARCGGLPLAIVVVAGLLSNITTDNWEVIAESVSSHVMGSETATRAIFALSYEHLPDYLKSCFLYMATFPRGYEIEVRILIRLWVAEGFIDEAPEMCLEDVAEERLHDLIDRSLLVSARTRSNGGLKTCRIHDLVLEFCMQEAQERKFLKVIKDFHQSDSNTTSDGHKRLSFHCHTFDNVHLTASKSLVGSALFFGISSDQIPDILIHYFDFKLLRVLDIISWRFDNFPTEQIAKLLLLRYLALTASFELPGILFKLQKLQTVIINGPWLVTSEIPRLPAEFWRSTSLRHLQLRAVNHLSFPEKSTEAESLNLLQTLTNISLASCTHESFSYIPNILKLGVCETHEDFSVVGLWDTFFQNLVVLKCIQTLKISCFGHNRSLPFPSLNAFPSSLTKLTLKQSNLPWEAMALIDDLPNLEVLKLRNFAFRGPEWETRQGGFRCLKYLLIEETDLMCWELEGCHFPRLEQLVLKFCQVLEEIPAEIGEISTLTHIKVEHCCSSVETSAKKIQEEFNEYGQDVKIQIRSQKTFSNASLEEMDG